MDADPCLSMQGKPREASPRSVAQDRNVIAFPLRRRARFWQWAEPLLALFSADHLEPRGRVRKPLAGRSAEIVRFRGDHVRRAPP